MPQVFLYGTLLDLDLLEIVLGRVAEVNPAVLPHCRSAWVDGGDFPMIYMSVGDQARGLVLDATVQDVARMNFYEGPFSYGLRAVQVMASGTLLEAQTYFPTEGLYQPGADWDIADWSRGHGTLRKLAAAEIMQRFGEMSAEDVNARYPVILARAQQVLNAVTSPSKRDLRMNIDADRIEIKATKRDHDNFFMVEEYDLTHPRYDGTQSREINRAVFVMADAVTVLPYDPVHDTVLLIEQFRAGIYRRGDPHPWSLEVIAGRIDGGETPESAALREAREEAGLEVGQLVRVGGYYSSPGATTEYMMSYVGLVDLRGVKGGIGGLATEDEDIRSLVVPFETLMAAVSSGEVENAPLLISALWLAANRARLRAGG